MGADFFCPQPCHSPFQRLAHQSRRRSSKASSSREWEAARRRAEAYRDGLRSYGLYLPQPILRSKTARPPPDFSDGPRFLPLEVRWVRRPVLANGHVSGAGGLLFLRESAQEVGPAIDSNLSGPARLVWMIRDATIDGRVAPLAGTGLTGVALKLLLVSGRGVCVVLARVLTAIVPSGTVLGCGGLLLGRPVPEAELRTIDDDLGLVAAVSLPADADRGRHGSGSGLCLLNVTLSSTLRFYDTRPRSYREL